MRCESLLGEYFGYIKDVDSRLFIDYCIDSNTVLKELQVTHNFIVKGVKSTKTSIPVTATFEIL